MYIGCFQIASLNPVVVYNWPTVAPLQARSNSIMEKVLRRQLEQRGSCECSASNAASKVLQRRPSFTALSELLALVL